MRRPSGLDSGVQGSLTIEQLNSLTDRVSNENLLGWILKSMGAPIIEQLN